MSKIKVTNRAEGTWLEPYIGWEFQVKKIGKNVVWFFFDNGGTKPCVEKYRKSIFDIIIA